MTVHARKRLQERYNIPVKDFYKLYEKAVKEKQFFQISNDDFYKDYHNGVSIVINAGNNKIIALSLCKKTGKIRTILSVHKSYILEAKKRGWIK